jgi:hypothetical protein
MRDASFRHNRHRAAVTAVRVTAQIALFGAALADSQQTEAGAHNGDLELRTRLIRVGGPQRR